MFSLLSSVRLGIGFSSGMVNLGGLMLTLGRLDGFRQTGDRFKGQEGMEARILRESRRGLGLNSLGP